MGSYLSSSDAPETMSPSSAMLCIMNGMLQSYQLHCVVDAHIDVSNLQSLDKKTRQRVIEECTAKKAVSASSGSGSNDWLLRGRVVFASGGNCELFGEATDGSHTHYWLRPVSGCGERINCLLLVEKDKVKLVQWNRNQRAAIWHLGESELQHGDECTVHSLVKRPDLNGCVGHIIGDMRAESKRYPLKVVSTGSSHLFKRTNLWRGDPLSTPNPKKGSAEATRIWQRCDLCDSHSNNLLELKAFATRMGFGSAEVNASVQNAMIEVEKRDEVLVDFMADCGWNALDNEFFSGEYRKTQTMRTKEWYVDKHLDSFRQMLPESGRRFDGTAIDASRERLKAVRKALKQQHIEEAIPVLDDTFPAFGDPFDGDGFNDDFYLDPMLTADFKASAMKKSERMDSLTATKMEQCRDIYKAMFATPSMAGAMVASIYQFQRQHATGDVDYDYTIPIGDDSDDDEHNMEMLTCALLLPKEFYRILLKERGITPNHNPEKVNAAIFGLFDTDTVLKGDNALYRSVEQRYKRAKD